VPIVRKRVEIAGRVQGVFFRQSCAERARRAGVCGWVRNRPDGKVEAVFQGEESAVEDMVAWCREGPPYARVDEIISTDEPVEPGADRFIVSG
jgi:acylphosphatase